MCLTYSYCILQRDPYKETMMAVAECKIFARGDLGRMLEYVFYFKENTQ